MFFFFSSSSSSKDREIQLEFTNTATLRAGEHQSTGGDAAYRVAYIEGDDGVARARLPDSNSTCAGAGGGGARWLRLMPPRRKGGAGPSAM